MRKISRKIEKKPGEKSFSGENIFDGYFFQKDDILAGIYEIRIFWYF